MGTDARRHPEAHRHRHVNDDIHPHPPSVSPNALLTDDMLARFDDRAPSYDRENRFFDEDFDELRASGYLNARCRRPTAGRASTCTRSTGCSGASPTTPRRRPSPSTCTCTGSAWPPTCAAPATTPATGSSTGRPTATCSAAGHGEAGNDLPLFLSLVGRARRRRLGDHRPQDLRQPVAGLDVPRRARHGHQRSGQPADRPRLPPPRLAALPHRGDVGHARHAGHPVARHHPRPRLRPRRGDGQVCPAGFAGADLFQVALFAWGLLGFAGVYTGIAQRAYDEVTASAAQPHVGGADPLDGVPPRGAAPRRRDAHPPRGDQRPPRPDLRRLVDGRRPRHEWPLKIVACKYTS